MGSLSSGSETSWKSPMTYGKVLPSFLISVGCILSVVTRLMALTIDLSVDTMMTGLENFLMSDLRKRVVDHIFSLPDTLAVEPPMAAPEKQ